MPPIVFLCYSQRDAVWKEKLKRHLVPLERTGRLSLWDDEGRLRLDDKLDSQIAQAIHSAKVAILLLSDNFLNSRYIQEVELPLLRDRQMRSKISIIHILVKDCLWQELPYISQFPLLPSGGRSLASIRSERRDRVFVEIVSQILKLVDDEESQGQSSMHMPVHTLEPPPPYFQNRNDEIEQLRSYVLSGTNVVGIFGMPGIGKTALALKLAESLVTSYPDAQIFLDLEGASSSPLSSIEAMRKVILEFHRGIRLEGDIKAHYRFILSPKRALLLMDNVAGAGQLEPLIPPPGNLLLFTSRYRFYVPGMRSRDLREISVSFAEKMLLEIAPGIGKGAGRIAEACGGYPFALEMAGRTLAVRPDIRPRAYAVYVERTAHNTLAERPLRVLYEILTSELQERWRALSVFEGGFDLAAASAVWSIREEEADQVLGALMAGFHVYGEDGRYQLHDLARAFARDCCGEQEYSMVRHRHAKYFNNILLKAGDLYYQGGSYSLQGLQLLDLEWSNIRFGQEWAVREDSTTSGGMTIDYANAGARILHLRLQSKDWLSWLEPALKASKRVRNRLAECNILNSMGLVYSYLGIHEQSLKLHEDALSIARELRDLCSEGNCWGGLGQSYAMKADFPHAMECYEKQLSISRTTGDQHGMIKALNGLGNGHRHLLGPRNSVELHNQALEIARALGDRHAEGAALGALGLAYEKMGNPRRSIGYYEEQIYITREIGDRRGEASALENLAHAYKDLGDLRRAVSLYKRVLCLAREDGDKRIELSVLGRLGAIYRFLERYRDAISRYEERLALSRDAGDQYMEGDALVDLADTYRMAGKAERATELGNQAREIARNMGHRRREADILGSLGKAYKALGEVQKAISLQRERLVIVRDISDESGEINALGSLGNLLKSIGDRSALEVFEKQIALTQKVGNRLAEGNALFSLGSAYISFSEHQLAIDAFSRCLIIARELSDRQGEARAAWSLGLALETSGDFSAAVEAMQICIKYELEVEYPDAEEHSRHLEELRFRLEEMEAPH